MHLLGLLYENDEGVDRDFKIILRKVSKTRFFTQNLILPQDVIRAFECYKRAADLRNSCAHNNLGLCFGMARGVDRDFEEAFKYYKKAADCYDKGTGVEIECTELPKKDADRLS